MQCGYECVERCGVAMSVWGGAVWLWVCGELQCGCECVGEVQCGFECVGRCSVGMSVGGLQCGYECAARCSLAMSVWEGAVWL